MGTLLTVLVGQLNSFKILYNLMCYFDVILLSDVISSIGPKISDTDTYMSKSDILGPNGNLCDIKNLVSFERELFEDFSYKYRIKIFLLFMSISPIHALTS